MATRAANGTGGGGGTQGPIAAADKAFGAARVFVEHLSAVAKHARKHHPSPEQTGAWQDVGFDFARAFIAWFDLSHLLTPAVRTEARRVYPPGSPGIKLGKAKPTPTVIEAVADELGVYFRNAVYAGRRHPLEPDRERVADEAKARATARQVAQSKTAEPFGWGADFDELMKKETRAAVRERLGIKTFGDVQDLMMREWKAQDREHGESALSVLRCGSIDFDDLQMQLVRESEAVIVAASKPNGSTISPELLAQLQTVIDKVGAMTRAQDERMARVEQVVTSIGMAEPKALPGPSRTEVVLWEGAEPTERNIRLARTRSAYLVAHGDVPAAMAALARDGNPVARSTFYNHLNALDAENPRWRESVQLSKPTGNLDGMRIVGARGKSRGKVR